VLLAVFTAEFLSVENLPKKIWRRRIRRRIFIRRKSAEKVRLANTIIEEKYRYTTTVSVR